MSDDEQTIPYAPERFSKPQDDFITERTKSLLPEWAEAQLAGFEAHIPYEHTLYLNFARSKGWVKKAGHALTASGFKIAASFLRR